MTTKRMLVVVAMVVLVAAAWRISERLSADAIAMGTGLLFGVVAGVPTALLLMASRRRREEYGDDYDDDDMPMMVGRRRGRGYELPHYPQQPVIVLAGPQYGSQPQQPPMVHAWDQRSALPALPGPQTIEGASRSFKVVGEQEEWIDEF